MSHLRILIPSGLPPVFLPYGISKTTKETAPETPDLLTGSSGLLESSSALESAISGESAIPEVATPSKGIKGRNGPNPKGGPLPSDAQIISWCAEVRRKSDLGNLTNEALCYWVRYTFETLSPEFNAVCDRISDLVEDIPVVMEVKDASDRTSTEK